MIECYCFLVRTIVEPPEPWQPLVLWNCVHFLVRPLSEVQNYSEFRPLPLGGYAEASKSSFWALALEPYVSCTFSLATCHFRAPGGLGAFWSSLSGLAVAPKACQGACLSRLGCLLWASLGLSGALGPDWGRGLQILILEPGSGAFRFVYILFSNLPLLGSWRPRCLLELPGPVWDARAAWGSSLSCLGCSPLGLQWAPLGTPLAQFSLITNGLRVVQRLAPYKPKIERIHA